MGQQRVGLLESTHLELESCGDAGSARVVQRFDENVRPVVVVVGQRDRGLGLLDALLQRHRGPPPQEATSARE